MGPATIAETTVKRIEVDDVEDSSELDPLVPGIWAQASFHAEFGERGTGRIPALDAFRSPTDPDALKARVKESLDGGATLLTDEGDLREGDVVYVNVRGQRTAHRIHHLRRGRRSRDARTLRVAQLSKVAD